MVVDQLPRLGKRELICLLLFTCNYVVFVWRGFLFLWVLGMGYVILLWHSLSLPYNYILSGKALTGLSSTEAMKRLEISHRKTRGTGRVKKPVFKIFVVRKGRKGSFCGI